MYIYESARGAAFAYCGPIRFAFFDLGVTWSTPTARLSSSRRLACAARAGSSHSAAALPARGRPDRPQAPRWAPAAVRAQCRARVCHSQRAAGVERACAESLWAGKGRGGPGDAIFRHGVCTRWGTTAWFLSTNPASIIVIVVIIIITTTTIALFLFLSIGAEWACAGQVFRDCAVSQLEQSPAATALRRQLYLLLADNLAKIHSADLEQSGLLRSIGGKAVRKVAWWLASRSCLLVLSSRVESSLV